MKREYTISFRTKKQQTSQTLRHSLDILDIDTQLNSPKIKLIQKLLNPTNALWKDLMLYWLNIDLILKSNHVLGLFRQNRFSGIIDTKIWKNRTMKISLFSYLMLGYISPIINSLPEADLGLLQHPRWKPVDYYHKVLHPRCCSSPRSTSVYTHVYRRNSWPTRSFKPLDQTRL